MIKLYYIISVILILGISYSCEDGYTEIEGNCYFQNDLDVIDRFIYNSSSSINMLLDDNEDGIIQPLELCHQEWNNGRIVVFDCNPIVINGEYNWMNLSGQFPDNIILWDSIERLLIPYNDLSGIVPQGICDLDLDFSDQNIFSLESNSFCPPYPECIEDYMGSQSNWGTGSCDIGNCYDVGIQDVAVIELNGDNVLNPYSDLDGVGSILVNIHNDGPSCSEYPGLMISSNTPGVTFPNASPYEGEGQIINWWYAIFANYTYFSNIQFEVSPYIPIGSSIDFTIETVTMGCYEDSCLEDPYCHECPLTPPYSFSLVVGELYPNMIGDANIDGRVDVLDIIMVVNYILFSDQNIFDESNQLFLNLVDLNNDNIINVLDIVEIIDFILFN